MLAPPVEGGMVSPGPTGRACMALRWLACAARYKLYVADYRSGEAETERASASSIIRLTKAQRLGAAPDPRALLLWRLRIHIRSLLRMMAMMVLIFLLSAIPALYAWR